MFRSLALLFLISSISVHAEPVFVGDDSDLDACSGYGKTRQTTQLHQSPRQHDAGNSLVPANTGLYICSESADGKWLGVIVQGSSADCGVSSPQRRRMAYKGKCKSGWLPTATVEYLAD